MIKRTQIVTKHVAKRMNERTNIRTNKANEMKWAKARKNGVIFAFYMLFVASTI